MSNNTRSIPKMITVLFLITLFFLLNINLISKTNASNGVYDGVAVDGAQSIGNSSKYNKWFIVPEFSNDSIKRHYIVRLMSDKSGGKRKTITLYIEDNAKQIWTESLVKDYGHVLAVGTKADNSKIIATRGSYSGKVTAPSKTAFTAKFGSATMTVDSSDSGKTSIAAKYAKTLTSLNSDEAFYKKDALTLYKNPEIETWSDFSNFSWDLNDRYTFAFFFDEKGPTAKITDYDYSSRKATIEFTDTAVKGAPVAGTYKYYFGRASGSAPATVISTVAEKSTQTVEVADDGTYYFSAEDAYKNRGSEQSTVFYKYIFDYNKKFDPNSSAITHPEIKWTGKAMPAPEIEKDTTFGYECIGWAKSKDAETPDYKMGASIDLNENTTFYAVWNKVEEKPQEPEPQEPTPQEPTPQEPTTMSFEDAIVKLDKPEYTYTGSAIEPGVVVTLGDNKLSKNIDYTVSYTDNIDAGEGTAIVEGLDKYEGKIEKTFTINKKVIDAQWSNLKFTYDGNEHLPTVNIISGISQETITTRFISGGESQKNVGKYTSKIEIDQVNGGQEKISNYLFNENTATKEWEIVPRELIIKPVTGQQKAVGAKDPEIKFDTSNLVSGEVAKYTGGPSRDSGEKVGEYEINGVGNIKLEDNGQFKKDNYTPKLDTEKVYFKIIDMKSELDVEGWMTENEDAEGILVSLRIDPDTDKANKNFYMLDEEVVYYIDYMNAGKTTEDEIKIVLKLPLEFEAVKTDNGEVDSENKTITWTFANGLEKNVSGTIMVTVKYKALSKKSYTSERIYPLATIYKNDKAQDKSSVINIIYKDDETALEDSHSPYMLGDADANTFRPDDYISRAEGALVLMRAFGVSYKNSDITNKFPDIGETYEDAQKAITQAVKIKVINGYDDGTYKPNEKMTRAEFMKIIASYIAVSAEDEEVEGLEVKEEENLIKRYNYSQMKNHWAIKYITELIRLNMTPVSSRNRNLRLDDKITRAEVAQLINYYSFRAPYNARYSSDIKFDDVERTHPLFGDIMEATRKAHDVFINEDGKEIDG